MHQDPGRTICKSQIRNAEPRHTARPSGFALRSTGGFMRTANDHHLVLPRHRGQQALHTRCRSPDRGFGREMSPRRLCNALCPRGLARASYEKQRRQPAHEPAGVKACAKRTDPRFYEMLVRLPNRWFCLVVNGCFHSIHRLHFTGSRCNGLPCLTPNQS
jgi:hypothetical protein